MIERTFTGIKPKHALPAGTIDTQLHAYLEGFPSAEGGFAIPYGTPSPSDYRKVMDWLGIERLVVTIGNAHLFDNSCLIACLNDFGPIAKGIAVVTADTSKQELEELSNAGVTGARVMDLPGGAIGMSELETVDKISVDMNWCTAVQFDGGKLFEYLPRLMKIKSRYIFDHHGKFFAGVTPKSPEIDAVKKMIDQGNCWFKFAGCYESSLSGLPNYEDVGEVATEIANYAPERIVWGTNWPHNLIQETADYPNDAALLDLVMDWVPDTATRQRLFVDNPAELFGF